MSYWSDFCRYMNDNRQYLPGALFSEVRRAAMARYAERLAAGRADSALNFRDLIERCESAIAPR